MTYRPKGWHVGKVAHNCLVGFGITFPTDETMTQAKCLVETGADAMLEGLRKEAHVEVRERADGGDTLSWTLPEWMKGYYAKGHLVFIPDKE